jgi:hypothetical protein
VARFYAEPKQGTITFYPADNADWRQLVDMDIFKGFRPGMSFRDAQNRIGPPDFKGTGPSGPYWIYRRSSGDVRLSHEEMGSIFLRRWWVLEGIPCPSSPDDIFHKNVAKEIPVDEFPMTIVIMNNKHHPGAFVEIKKGRVVNIHWPDNPGSGASAT